MIDHVCEIRTFPPPCGYCRQCRAVVPFDAFGNCPDCAGERMGRALWRRRADPKVEPAPAATRSSKLSGPTVEAIAAAEPDRFHRLVASMSGAEADLFKIVYRDRQSLRQADLRRGVKPGASSKLDDRLRERFRRAGLPTPALPPASVKKFRDGITGANGSKSHTPPSETSAAASAGRDLGVIMSANKLAISHEMEMPTEPAPGLLVTSPHPLLSPEEGQMQNELFGALQRLGCKSVAQPSDVYGYLLRQVARRLAEAEPGATANPFVRP